VVVDYVDQNNSYNFPSSFEDDPVLDLLLEDVKNSYLYSEERRLFYVATTR
jgi:superfamily I DNA/RNA helicase